MENKEQEQLSPEELAEFAIDGVIGFARQISGFWKMEPDKRYRVFKDLFDGSPALISEEKLKEFCNKAFRQDLTKEEKEQVKISETILKRLIVKMIDGGDMPNNINRSNKFFFELLPQKPKGRIMVFSKLIFEQAQSELQEID